MNPAGSFVGRSRRFAPGKAATLAFLALATAVGGAFAGCGTSTIDFCDPNNYDDHVVPPDILARCDGTGVDGGDAGDASDTTDAGDATADAPLGQACPGQCVPGPSDAWNFPDLVWIGSPLQKPPCPDSAPVNGYTGYADLVATNVCGACQCDPPTGSCGLPSAITAHAANCATMDSGTAQTSFDPPAGWDGACTTSDAVSAGQPCAGSPCVQSLTIAPLVLNESGCTPTQLPVPKDSTTTWNTIAQTCRGFPQGACDSNGDVCLPTVPPSDGFRVCIYRPGDIDCPKNSPYQERHVFYDGFADTRSCSPCGCGPPDGSACTSEVTVYSDGACSSLPVVSVLTDAKGPVCLDVISGSALGSKAASAPVYAAGTCQPTGGEPMGSAEPMNPSTICCIPSP